MEHTMTYNAKELKTVKGSLIIEGPVPSEKLAQYEFHEDLVAFRPPQQQHKALIEIASLPEGRIIIARDGMTIVGYVTYLYPDPLERWSEGNMKNLIELGAIEVIPKFRGAGTGKSLLQVSMMDDYMENYIIITTEYYWHWDLKGTGLNVWEYRKVMEKMMNAGGLEWYATDDPEISSHPANCLMARIGKRVDPESIQRFDQLRFMNRFMY
ncbi:MULTISPECIES: GNAT family N-acetyltransferase [Bacillaceae]|jgi:acetoin utilization protein AcuA|uniref:Acetoin utilization protein AcuA n=1 Tax=Bacillus infantis TaxID=324767 RepID=A0A5D4S373_9BACI|nr:MULTISPECIES: GNAT family N-acetyltransferase [Bacillus]OXT18802.1 N-acetyltransferase [Bacillus sp. OG2]MCA1036559.1 GNAT family N-acetyltransferase [Bacillus infantis]MCK6205134.1 GNAT family N-acetyltransferase [Bacillus infantis]MCP1160113.1 GNAT family N-acetyltransferase [Bacillus infantis]MDT0161741.1 GNAT family N-acetyltransferase [Bacillus sp. AG4(2022)]